jgi:hypothetical protein
MRFVTALVMVLATAGLPHAVRAEEDAAARLMRAYPGIVTGSDKSELTFADGTSLPLSDGKSAKSEDDLLDDPDIDDMFAYAYPRTKLSGPPVNDAGRIRNEAFFAKVYGDCRKGGVKADLVPVAWLPRHKGGTVMINRRNGAAEKLEAISRELDRQPASVIATLIPSAGTFNCRAIAGTNRLSAHGYGIAIDINTAVSDYWRWSKAGYRNRIPDIVVETFERHGYIWGGKWKHFDTMHFEYRPEMLPQ